MIYVQWLFGFDVTLIVNPALKVGFSIPKKSEHRNVFHANLTIIFYIVFSKMIMEIKGLL